VKSFVAVIVLRTSQLLWPPSRMRLYGTHSVLFTMSLAVLYRCMPRFLVQNHDGQNLYNYFSQAFTWQRSWLDVFIFTPLHGTGDIIWPINPLLYPMAYGFLLFDSPTLRIFSLQIIAGASIFVACLIFYGALGLGHRVVVATAWICSLMYLLQSVEYLSGTDGLQVVVYTYLAAAAFVSLGNLSVSWNVLMGAAFQGAILLLVLSHPGYHVHGLPVLACLIAAFIATSKTRQEMLWKGVTATLAVIIHAVFGTYTALYYTFTDTARSLLSSDFPEAPHVPWIAGHLFRSSATEIALGAVFIFGLVKGDDRDLSADRRTARAIRMATVLFYGCAMLGAIWFLYSGHEWRGPKLAYIFQFAYPLAALFAVVGLWQLNRTIRWSAPVQSPPAVQRFLPWAAVLGYLAWHALSRFGTSPGLVPAIAFGTIGLALLRRGYPHTAGVLAIPLLLIGLYRGPEFAFGPTYDDRIDGRQRMGLVSNPILQFLASRVGLAPGKQFAGYADDAYARLPLPDLNAEIITTWLNNWREYGNGHKLFAWNAFGIPTITEYSPYIRPLYFSIFAHLLNEPTDQQWVNYLTITRPDERILSMLGVRYLISNRAELPNSRLEPIMRWRRLYLFELPAPNIASYSPTRGVVVQTATEALERLADKTFDPHKDVVMTMAMPTRPLSSSDTPAELIFERGGYTVRAVSPALSLIVLPVQFSHCFRVRIVSGDRNARLLRVNLVQTGLLFEREVALEARLVRWPLASPHCQKLDFAENLALRVREAQRRGGPAA
jgi:hypothetical protein